MYRKEIVSIKFLYLLLFLLLLNIITIVFISSILTLQEFGFGLLEINLVGFVLTYATYIYRKYNQEVFKKRSILSGKKQLNLKLDMLLIIFFYGLIEVIFYLLIAIFFYEFFLNDTNFVFTSFNHLEWKQFQLGWYLFFGATEVLVLLFFAYFLNYYLKQKNFIYGIIILAISYLFLKGPTFGPNLDGDIIGNQVYIVWGYNLNKRELILRAIFMPWSPISIWGSTLFRNYYGVLPSTSAYIHWFDFSKLQTFVDGPKVMYFTIPYFFIFIYATLPRLTNFLSSTFIKNNKQQL